MTMTGSVKVAVLIVVLMAKEVTVILGEKAVEKVVIVVAVV